MAPKNKFTKEQIIDCAFDIAKVNGINSITIRKVAENLGSSIAPIYVNFNNVEELKREVIRKLIKVSNDILGKQDSGNPFLDLGVASILAAKKYRALFTDFILNPNTYLEEYDRGMEQTILAKIQSDQSLQGFSEEEVMTIFLKMKIFQTGLSIMVGNNLLPKELGEEQIINLLEGTGHDIITAARLRKENNND
ncbi:TetR/AcrR family transcriptional regulator [Evansella tamaricis]|uniref:TetR/AcrR family transcriptional regulator n=1 Tax=Evansella tamaricis TaxID=2069301 RepID=A0ABS6JCW0_9BACI|nr:TetR/AcrR family transcriptional regulator [Evansella tamaricis]MBU9711348.1 TetR/AcrR family transcriptional regulator [Evansella tamaricis]